MLLTTAYAAYGDQAIVELVVTSHRQPEQLLRHAGNIERLGAQVIRQVAHQHVSELMTRVPGAWLSRGSGQEHLTAIRSPVLTGAGSCGGFLFLEDGIPIRPAGFCNVNSLLEADTEQAHAIEVIRGPANALYGSSALHGVVNVLMPTASDRDRARVAVEVGANEFVRARASLPPDAASPWLASFVYSDDGGFRDDSGYRQGKLHLSREWQLEDSELRTALTYTDLDQDTAGFIVGKNAYKDPALATSNANPEAFREASALRVYGTWNKALGPALLDVRPYARWSDMRFLQHFLPGQPLEENGHKSIGALVSVTLSGNALSTVVGVDFEWSDVFLRETQDGPTAGSPFLMETRPAGKHYDYTSSGRSVAAYVQTSYQAVGELQITAGLRLERHRYDYDNRMLSGNTRDDGTQCGFGGCLYSRPADRSDDFSDFAPKLSLSRPFGESTQVYLAFARGFRAPQVTELYRLQSGQQVADLDSETVTSIELGARGQFASLAWDAAAYTMQKRDSIYRDAEGFNVSGGRSTHDGLEVALNWAPNTDWLLSLVGTYARHRYDFNASAAQGETFVTGRDVDTAPRWQGSLDLQYAVSDRIDLALQWTVLGAYFLDAENQFRYPGHGIVNLRAAVGLSERTRLTLRLNNALDRAFADRADYAFGDYRYFPGRRRELFAEFELRL